MFAPSLSLRQRLRALGYVEGRNLIVDTRRVTNGKPKQSFVMAQELVKANVEEVSGPIRSSNSCRMPWYKYASCLATAAYPSG